MTSFVGEPVAVRRVQVKAGDFHLKLEENWQPREYSPIRRCRGIEIEGEGVVVLDCLWMVVAGLE